jgi:hypothetical protein
MPVDEITHMGQARKQKVAALVQEAKKKHWTPGMLAERLKRVADTPTKRDKRDWYTVARTELTDVKAHDSIDAILEKHGRKARVIRKTGDACEACLHAFGHPSKPRVWTAGTIPDHLKGAVHPNCKCSPWLVVGIEKIKKAVVEAPPPSWKNHANAMIYEHMTNLPKDPHHAANKKSILFSYHDHINHCHDPECKTCSRMYNSIQKEDFNKVNDGVTKAFKLPEFNYQMRFVIAKHLKPKKISREQWKEKVAEAGGAVAKALPELALNTEYDVPYTGGTSENRKTIYIDRKLPRYFTTTEKVKADVHKYLMIHECTEAGAMDKLGLNYNDAHQIALGAEIHALTQDGVSVDEYYGFLGPHVKENLKIENINKVPADLDLKPYIEDKLTAVLARIKQLRGKKNASVH